MSFYDVYAARPLSEVEWEELLVRYELTPRALRVALDDGDPAGPRVADLVHAIDLDLDVIRRWDGQVELLDEDEFETHQRLYQYPAEVITEARTTAATLLAMVANRDEPFDTVGEAWLTRLTGGR